jgi:NAD(P)-dependent dehydrogenase (short-subunit alcohol dehydrogenase family)
MSKTILITGASSGFGRDTAETLFRDGHTVYASMRSAQGKNREAAEALRKLGIKTVELDVSDDASVEAASRTCWRTPARSMCWSTTPASCRSA